MSEIITGLASSVVTLTVAYFVFRKDDKANQLTYITDERRKWREKIRELSVTFMTGGKYNSLRNEELRDIREKVAVRLNPDDVEDKYILCLMDCYIENNCNLLKDKIRKKLSLAFASLLKHDWDRAKKGSGQFSGE